MPQPRSGGSLPNPIWNPNSEVAGRAREAEHLLRECLSIRLKTFPETSPRLADTRNCLGGALIAAAVTDAALAPEARTAKLAEAEPLLLQSQQVLHRSDRVERRQKRNALIRLVRLYETLGNRERAAEWQKKLDGLARLQLPP